MFATLQHCNVATLQHCNFATYNIATFSHFNIVTLQHCNIATLQHRNFATLQHCRSARQTSWMDQFSLFEALASSHLRRLTFQFLLSQLLSPTKALFISNLHPQTKMYLRLDFDSGIGPLCFHLFSKGSTAKSPKFKKILERII